MNLYTSIGDERIEKAVREFYKRAVEDVLIGHFFFKIDIEKLIAKQIDFTHRLLGKKNPEPSKMRSLKAAHFPLKIRPVHFARRQKLMEEVLNDLRFTKEESTEWLKRELNLKSLIIKETQSCLE